MNKNFYNEQKKIILDLLKNNEYEKALKIINDELNMPYIPREFEKFLLISLNEINPHLNKLNNNYVNFSVEKIVDILIKFDNLKYFSNELINKLDKFNLAKEIDEIDYFFQKVKNKKSIALFFEILIKQKIDVNTPLGNPRKSLSFKEEKNYLSDLKKIDELLDNDLNFREISIDLMNDIYLTKHFNNDLESNLANLIIYLVGKIFDQKKLLLLVKDDIDEIKKKLINLKTFETL